MAIWSVKRCPFGQLVGAQVAFGQLADGRLVSKALAVYQLIVRGLVS